MDFLNGHGDGQYLAPMDEKMAEQIASDPVAVIRGLNGRSLNISELGSVIPGNCWQGGWHEYGKVCVP